MKNKKNGITIFFIVSSIIAAVSAVLLFLSRRSSAFAEYISGSVSQSFRRLMAAVGELVPFSLFELVIALLPFAVAFIIVLAVRAFRRGEGRIRLILSVTGIIFLLLSAYNVSMGTAYHTTPLSARLGLEVREVDRDGLVTAMEKLVGEVNRLSDSVEFSDGVSEKDLTLDELSVRISAAHSHFSESHGLGEGFDSRAKGMVASPIMSLLGLTGIYTFYTGEANVNLTYPTFDVAFTAAHELSHQRGVLRENEANMLAFLVLYESGDEYLRYAAALTMIEYVGYALYQTDEAAYRDILSSLDSIAFNFSVGSSSISSNAA